MTQTGGCLLARMARPLVAAALDATYSVELVVSHQEKHEAKFLEAAKRLMPHPRIAFITFGSVSPIVRSPIAMRTAQELCQLKKQRGEGGGGADVCWNVTCAGTDAATLSDTLSAVSSMGVKGLCVLSGNAPKQPTDAFRFPTEMLKYIASRTLRSDITLAAAGTPSEDKVAAERDWKYVEEKVNEGNAEVVFATPTLSLDVISTWLHSAHPTVRSSSLISGGLEKNHFVAVPSFLTPLRCDVLERIASKRGWRLPPAMQAARERPELFLDAHRHVTVEHIAAVLSDPSASCRHIHLISYSNDAASVERIIHDVDCALKQRVASGGTSTDGYGGK